MFGPLERSNNCSGTFPDMLEAMPDCLCTRSCCNRYGGWCRLEWCMQWFHRGPHWIGGHESMVLKVKDPLLNFKWPSQILMVSFFVNFNKIVWTHEGCTARSTVAWIPKLNRLNKWAKFSHTWQTINMECDKWFNYNLAPRSCVYFGIQKLWGIFMLSDVCKTHISACTDMVFHRYNNPKPVPVSMHTCNPIFMVLPIPVTLLNAASTEILLFCFFLTL